MIDKSMLGQSFKLAWPISLQNVLVTLLSMVDVIMVGHLGDAAVASVGLGNRIQFVVMIICMGLAWGVGVLSAQYFGAGQSHRIRQAIQIAITIAIAALFPIICANFLVADKIVGFASNDISVISLGQQYLWITIPSLLMVAVILIIENALRSINQVRLPMVFSAFAIGCNILLNYWLINGGLGIEALGVEGAAWATTISRVIHLSTLLYFLISSKHMLAPKRSDLEGLKQKKAWWKLFNLVWPMMISFGIWSIGTFVYQLIYGNLGTTELAVMSLISPIEGIFISIFFGVASACSIMLGQQLGNDQFDVAWRIGKTFSFLCPVFALFIGLIALLIEPILMAPYAQMSAETLSLAHQIFILVALGAWIKIFNMTLALGMLRAGGDNRYCMISDILGLWVVSIPLTLTCAFVFNLPLLWVALAAYSEEVVKLVLFGYRVLSKKWMKNLSEPEASA